MTANADIAMAAPAPHGDPRPDELQAISSPGRPAVRLRLIGAMQAWTADGVNVTPVSPRARAVLAILAMSQPRSVMRAWLADLLWSNPPNRDARPMLRHEVHRLQEGFAGLEQVLTASRSYLGLRPGSVWVDVKELRSATIERPDALSLYDRELLEDLDGIDPAFDNWLRVTREQLRDEAVALAQALLTRSNSGPDVITASWRLLSIDSTHEGAWRALMRAHADAGRIETARQAFAMCRNALARRLQAVPSDETMSLLHEITDRARRVSRAGAETAGSGASWARVLAHAPTLCVSPMRWLTGPSPDPGFAGRISAMVAEAIASYRAVHVLPPGQGSDYVVDGTMADIGGPFRLTLRLLDARDGDRLVWAERFEQEANDARAEAVEIAAAVAARIDRELFISEGRRAEAMARSSAARESPSYNLVMRAVPLMIRLEREGFMLSGTLLREAAASGNGRAQGLLALWQALLIRQGWSDDPDADREGAWQSAEDSLAEACSPRRLSIAGFIKVKLRGAPEEAMRLFDQALDMDPHVPLAWAFSAIGALHLGDARDASRRYERYREIVSRNLLSFVTEAEMTKAPLLRGDYAEAAAAGRYATQMAPNHADSYKPYLAALGYLGQTREAGFARDRLLTIDPGFSVSSFSRTTALRKPGDRALVAEGLRRAGVALGS